MTCMAEIVGVHGIRGVVKMKVFADDPLSLAGGPPLCDSAGKILCEIEQLTQHGTIWLATLKGLADRTAAEKLRGTKLYVSRDSLAEIKTENTYYHADLIGMEARYESGDLLGHVIAVANFGAGDLLEVKPPKGNSFYLPFTQRSVPHVDVAKKVMTVDPPDGLLD